MHVYTKGALILDRNPIRNVGSLRGEFFSCSQPMASKINYRILGADKHPRPSEILISSKKKNTGDTIVRLKRKKK